MRFDPDLRESMVPKGCDPLAMPKTDQGVFAVKELRHDRDWMY